MLVYDNIIPLSCFYLDTSITLNGLTSGVQLTANPNLLQVGASGALAFRTTDTSGILLHIHWALSDNPSEPGYDYLTLEIFDSLIRINGNFSGGVCMMMSCTMMHHCVICMLSLSSNTFLCSFTIVHFLSLLLALFSLTHPDVSVSLGMWHTVSWLVDSSSQVLSLTVDCSTVNESIVYPAAPPSGSEIPTISLGGANFEMQQNEGKKVFIASSSYTHTTNNASTVVL